MEVNAINPAVTQARKPLSKGQKVAIATAAGAAVAGTASVLVAATLGKTPDTKLVEAIKNGYGQMGKVVKNLAGNAWDGAKTGFGNAKEAVVNLFHKKAADVAEVAENAAENV